MDRLHRHLHRSRSRQARYRDLDGGLGWHTGFAPDVWRGTREVAAMSPDGKYLSFLSERSSKGKTQVWLLDRRGGDAFALTDVKEEISSYRWSPDGKKLVLEMSPSEEDQNKSGGTKSSGPQFKGPKPIVIDRSHFKEDVEGYLATDSRTQLYLFDVETKKLEPLTTERNFDDRGAIWSADGARIAYVSNHAKDPDTTGTEDI